ncbi:hypothetical protein BKA60DRAFT_685514 [Fusarium oxysporum]|nr:hypothetical protein BKA60DRAFT_685514 [Fusarium oxysporum]KAH7482885.1 hypothetical protein FOMA001_g7244 [Fusarium oxysporum f. sp. matthiolae]
MATQDQSFGNDDLEELSVHLSELKLSLSVAPNRRPQKRNRKGTQTSITALADTKNGIIEQAEHSSFRVPANKTSRQLYEKLREIRDADADCTEEDVDQITSLLKSFIHQIDPDHPFIAETEDSLADDETVDVSVDVSGNQPRRHRNMVFTNYNENDMIDAAWNGFEDDENTGQGDDEAGDPDYQDEPMDDDDDDDDYEEAL